MEILSKDKQREFMSLTDDEVREIAKDIFQAKEVTRIDRDHKHGMITIEMDSEWRTTENENSRIDVIRDEVRIMNPFDHGTDAIQVPWEENAEDYIKLKQYCFAKGIYGATITWLIDNPYIQCREQAYDMADVYRKTLEAIKTDIETESDAISYKEEIAEGLMMALAIIEDHLSEVQKIIDKTETKADGCNRIEDDPER